MTKRKKLPPRMVQVLIFVPLLLLVLGFSGWAYFAMGMFRPTDKLEIALLSSSNATEIFEQVRTGKKVLVEVCSGVVCERQAVAVNQIAQSHPEIMIVRYEPVISPQDDFDVAMSQLIGNDLPVFILFAKPADLNQPQIERGYKTAEELKRFVVPSSNSTSGLSGAQTTAAPSTVPKLKHVVQVNAGDWKAKIDSLPQATMMVAIICSTSSPLCTQELAQADAVGAAAAQNGVKLSLFHLDLSQIGALEATSDLVSAVTQPAALAAAEPITILRFNQTLIGVNGMLTGENIIELINVCYKTSRDDTSPGGVPPRVTAAPVPTSSSSK